jgi:hypothetical protein
MKENYVIDKIHTNYPSRYAIGEQAFLDFGSNNLKSLVTIKCIYFDLSKVYYDVELEVQPNIKTILHRIDSIFLQDIESITLLTSDPKDSMFFLSQDGSSHWCIVPEAKRQDWDQWLEQAESEDLEYPDYIKLVGGDPSQVIFSDPTII